MENENEENEVKMQENENEENEVKKEEKENEDNEQYEPTIKDANIFDIEEDNQDLKEKENSKYNTNQFFTNDTFNSINSLLQYSENKNKQKEEKKFIYDSFEQMYYKSKRNKNKFSFDFNSMKGKNAFKYKELLKEINLIDSINYENKNKNYIPYKTFNSTSTFYTRNISPEPKNNISSYRNSNINFTQKNNDLFSELKFPSKDIFNLSELSKDKLNNNFFNIGSSSNSNRINFRTEKYPLSHYYNNELKFFGDILGKNDKEKFLKFPKNHQSFLTTNFSKTLEKNKALEKLKNWDS